MFNRRTHSQLGKIDPFNKKDRIFYSFLVLVGLYATVLFGFWWFLPTHVANNFKGIYHIFDYLLFVLLSFVVWYQIMNELLAWSLAERMKLPIPSKPQKNLKVAFLTAFVPGKEPYSMLKKTLTAMINVDYPHDTWVLDEGDDPKVKDLCKKLGVNHFSRKNVEKYNQPTGKFKAKTKAGNFNAWFDFIGDQYDIVAQLDVDFIPGKNFLTETLGYFKNPEVGFVGTPQIYGNKKDSWIVRGASEQSYGFYGPTQKGLFGTDMTFFIGANHVIRVKAYRNIEGYEGHIIEDHLTGMKFYSKKWKSIYVPKTLAVGEGPSTWESYFNQQMRWSYGLFDVLFRHSPKMFKKMNFIHSIYYFFMQQFYFYGLAQGLSVVLLVLFYLFGINSANISLRELLIFYPLLLAIQQIIFFYLQRFYIDPEEESGFNLSGRLLSIAVWPVYLLAFFSAITGKRLAYQVTPKGKNQPFPPKLKLFLPHFVLGTISFLGIIFSILLNHISYQLIFFGSLNTVFMYGIIGSVLWERLKFKSSLFIPKLILAEN